MIELVPELCGAREVHAHEVDAVFQRACLEEVHQQGTRKIARAVRGEHDLGPAQRQLPGGFRVLDVVADLNSYTGPDAVDLDLPNREAVCRG